MKRPLAYITAAWSGEHEKDGQRAAGYCRAVYEAGFSPLCPVLYLPLILNDAIPEEHKSGIDMGRDLLRRAHVLVVCGDAIDEAAGVSAPRPCAGGLRQHRGRKREKRHCRCCPAEHHRHHPCGHPGCEAAGTGT